MFKISLMVILAKLVQSADKVERNAAAAAQITLNTVPDLIPYSVYYSSLDSRPYTVDSTEQSHVGIMLWEFLV